jgi:hypothetical protein
MPTVQRSYLNAQPVVVHQVALLAGCYFGIADNTKNIKPVINIKKIKKP